jgi:hypothetical protein
VPSVASEPRVSGEAILYRLFDVGYEIRLDRAFDLLSSSAPERPKPVRGEAHALQIQNPPVTVSLGVESIAIGEDTSSVEVSARIFDFGVISLRARIPARPFTWEEFVAFGVAAGTSGAWGVFEHCRDRLLERIRAAIERPQVAPVTEEYIIYRLHRVESEGGNPIALEALPDEGIARLLLGEVRPIAAGARRELLSQRLSYFDDDLAVLTWNAALVVETVPEDEDVQYVLEFANAQLLELRYHDSLLDSELPRTYDEIAAARGGFHLLGRRFSRLLTLLQTRVADSTEAVERVENSLKVTDDVFLARIYGVAMDIFRGPTWRRGIDRKVAIIRDAYTMLNAEAQARRAEVMELAIIALIAAEILIAMWMR